MDVLLEIIRLGREYGDDVFDAIGSAVRAIRRVGPGTVKDAMEALGPAKRSNTSAIAEEARERLARQNAETEPPAED